MKPGLLPGLCAGLLLLTVAGCSRPASPDGVAPAASAPPAAVGPGAGAPEPQESELLIGYRSGAAFDSAGERSRRAARHLRRGGESLREFPHLRLEHVRLAPGLGVEEAIQRYQQDPDVEYAEPNYPVHANAVPSDPLLDLQWALRNSGQTGGTPGVDLRMTQAWDLAQGSPTVLVAVLDTGFDLGHEDLVANLWTNDREIPGNGVDDDGDGFIDDVHGIDVLGNALTTPVNPQDDNGHGTHVAGTIGAVTGNGLGVAGVNWRVGLIPCKFLDASGSGSTANAIRCLEYVRGLRARGLDVVATNNSWSGGPYTQALERAIAAQGDILFVVSSGNDSLDSDRSRVYPASYDLPNVLAVSATDHADARPSWANYGRTTVAVSAPGVEIVSLRAAGTDMYRDGRHFVPDGDPAARYYRASGTSMAAPHVAGLVALLHAWDPGLDWRGARNLVLAGAQPVPALEGLTATGRRIDAFGSLTCTARPLMALLPYRQPFPVPAGAPATFSVLSIDCRAPAGPVRATLSDGTAVDLRDDGVAPDQAAGDGVFTATVTPSSTIAHVTYASPAGTVTAPHFDVGPHLASANVHAAYRQVVGTLGGAAPFAWSILSGALPGGLQLDPASGAISGTPLAAGRYPVQVRAVDAVGRVATAQLGLDVYDDLVTEPVSFVDVGPAETVPLAFATDAAGNGVVAGYYVDPLTARNDFAVRKYGPDGQVLWSRNRLSLAAWSRSWAWGVAIDGAGAIYVVGGNASGFAFNDVMLVKYAPDGQELWASPLGIPTGRIALGLAVDPAGDVLVSGMRSLGTNQSEAFTAKYGPDGAPRWEQNLQVGLLDRAFAVATDPSGNVYVAGDSGTVWRTDGVFTQYTYAFLTAKYDPAGNLLWTRTGTEPGSGPDLAGALAIAVDAAGNAYVGGRFSSTTLYKYDTDGGLVWRTTQNVAGPYHPDVDSLAFDGNGDLLVAGHRRDWNAGPQPYFVSKVSQAGIPFWTRLLDGDYRDLAIDVAAGKGNATQVSRPYAKGVVVSAFHERVQVTTVSPLAPGLRGLAYSAFMTARAGQAPYAWRISGGTPPPGITIDPATGELRGIATAGGEFTFTVAATGLDGSTGEGSVTLPMEYLWFDQIGFPPLSVGKGFRQVLVAQGTATPFAWRVVAGALPPGLSLGRSSGAITGTPTRIGTYPFTVQVTDREGHTALQDGQIDVFLPLVITTARLPAARVGVPYLARLAATGGAPDYFWDLSRGALPDGLYLDFVTGEITGTPTTVGERAFTVIASDQVGLAATRRFSIEVKRR